MNADHLGNASIQAHECAESLRKALSDASAVEAIILLPLIERAAILQRDIAAFFYAVAP